MEKVYFNMDYRVASGIVIVMALFLSVARPVLAEFVPNEQLISMQRDLIDVEYNQLRAQFTWCDMNGNLWIGKVDPVSGFFKPANGKAILVDSDAMTVSDLAITFNGPEWISSAEGDKIVYTKFAAGMSHTAARARLAVAKELASGSWTVEILPGRPRLSPYASEELMDPSPRITYTDNKENHFWRELDDAATEHGIPLPPSVKSVRFVRGHRAVIFSTPVGSVSQVFLYEIDTQVLSQLTYDGGQKDLQTVPWMWRAPEFSDDFVFMTVVDNAEIRFYRFDPSYSELDLGNAAAWSKAYSIALPANTKIASPEPFIYLGKSYLFFAMTEEPNNFPSSIWLANIDSSNPIFRTLNNGILRVRSDPELFVTASGPYIYYNRYNQTVNPDSPYCAACSEGVFRAFTGLPSPIQ